MVYDVFENKTSVDNQASYLFVSNCSVGSSNTTCNSTTNTFYVVYLLRAIFPARNFLLTSKRHHLRLKTVTLAYAHRGGQFRAVTRIVFQGHLLEHITDICCRAFESGTVSSLKQWRPHSNTLFQRKHCTNYANRGNG